MDATNEASVAVVPKERSGPSPLVRVALIAAGVIALLIAIVLGVKYFAYASTHETTDDATVDADVVQITSKIAERVDRVLVDTNVPVKRGQLLVQLDSQDERDRVAQAVAADSAARAQERAARQNVALTRDTQSAQNLQSRGAIDQAKAAIQSAAAQASSSAGQIAAAQSEVDAMAAQLTAAQSALPGAAQNLRKEQADLRRTQSLVSTGDLARAQLDSVRAQYAVALSQYSEAIANVKTAGANLSQSQQKLDSQRYTTASTQAQIGVQQATLTTAQGKYAESNAPSRIAAQQAQAQATGAQIASTNAQLGTAQSNLGYTRIVSPIGGYVGQKNVEIGQTVSPGESLMTLIPATGMYITANFKETQIGRMKVGQEVDINVDAYSGAKFVGHVDNLSPAAQNQFSLVPPQNATGNFVKVTQRLPVRILVDRVEGGNLANYALRPGMSVETSVKVK